jgi:hypothetical protein
MRKLITTLFLALIFFILALPTQAQNVAGNSAVIVRPKSENTDTASVTTKKMAIVKLLKKYNSPLAQEVNSFISTCVTYELDCYLLPSITGLESTFGKFTYPNSNNPFGWGGGLIMFENWSKGIETVGKGLRENYINKGADTVEKIAPIYAASPTWSSRVQYFIAEFKKEEENVAFILSSSGVEL